MKVYKSTPPLIPQQNHQPSKRQETAHLVKNGHILHDFLYQTEREQRQIQAKIH